MQQSGWESQPPTSPEVEELETPQHTSPVTPPETQQHTSPVTPRETQQNSYPMPNVMVQPQTALAATATHFIEIVIPPRDDFELRPSDAFSSALWIANLASLDVCPLTAAPATPVFSSSLAVIPQLEVHEELNFVSIVLFTCGFAVLVGYVIWFTQRKGIIRAWNVTAIVFTMATQYGSLALFPPGPTNAPLLPPVVGDRDNGLVTSTSESCQPMIQPSLAVIPPDDDEVKVEIGQFMGQFRGELERRGHIRGDYLNINPGQLAAIASEVSKITGESVEQTATVDSAEDVDARDEIATRPSSGRMNPVGQVVNDIISCEDVDGIETESLETRKPNLADRRRASFLFERGMTSTPTRRNRDSRVVASQANASSDSGSSDSTVFASFDGPSTHAKLEKHTCDAVEINMTESELASLNPAELEALENDSQANRTAQQVTKYIPRDLSDKPVEHRT